MRLRLPRKLSLANKCLLLFGGAVVLIVLAALAPPWLRMNALVEDRQRELLRQKMDTWQRLDARAVEQGLPRSLDERGAVEHGGIRVRRLTVEEAEAAAEDDPLHARALVYFEDDPTRRERMWSSWDGIVRVYSYYRAVGPTESGQRLAGLLVIEQRSDDTATALVVNTVYQLSAGLVVLAPAIVVFYLITHKLVLGPVRQLRETAEKVKEGDLGTRSDIRTGDEYQELAEAFNGMLSELQTAHDQQRSVNRALDLKLNELAQANSVLYEANRLKADFLANVSHELRTPLNSIIGFAELLQEIASQEAKENPDNAHTAKRLRYLSNIVDAGRGLLEMIESLLEMAKIEAGRVELRFEPLVLREACETLAALIHPQASRKGIEVIVDVPRELPVIRTDHKRFQQIIFNFLSNAVKFIEPAERTGRPGRITVRAERLIAASAGDADAVRISVIDTGPGIPPEEQARIFEKFHQIETGHTREHRGTGLGLAIARELATILQGEIQVDSAVGQGSMFSLIVPIRPDQTRVRETKLEKAFRASLASGRPVNGGRVLG